MTLRAALLLAAVSSAAVRDADGAPESAPAVVAPAPRAVGRLTGDRLAGPVPVEAEGRPIVRQGAGYELRYPFVGDIDGDGRPDLLLGDRRKGQLRVYRNVGTAAAPRLAAPVWFDESVPTGKVPYG